MSRPLVADNLSPLPMMSTVGTATSSSAEQRAADLPAYLSVLIGREAEVAAITKLLRGDDRPQARTADRPPAGDGASAVRLLTLSSPGGVGKTRLAVEVAAAVRAEFADGVAFVDLAPVRDSELVAPTIARALGIAETGRRSIRANLVAALRHRHVLLLIDNFEHLLPAATLVTELLACPEVTALVTSRAPLRLSGEQVFPVSPLALPGPVVAGPAAAPRRDYTSSPAVQLFVERARAIEPGFRLTDTNAPAITEICRRLDGLPLALELAAARTHVLSPTALLARLEPCLPLLARGPRDWPARRQTLQDTIAWSYDLLTPTEQTLFRRLAVFAGGFSVDATAWVTGVGSGRASGAGEAVSVAGRPTLTAARMPDRGQTILAHLEALVDRSLVTVERRPDEAESLGPRFAMLETIREYGRERLIADGLERAAQNAHAAYYLALMEEIESDLYEGRHLVHLLHMIEREHPNLRTALTHLLATHQTETSLRLAGALVPFWLFGSHRTEGRWWLEQVINASQDADVPLASRARALGGAAVLAFTQADYPRATTFVEMEVALWRETGDRLGIAAALNLLGAVKRAQGTYDQAAVHFEEALARFQALGNDGRVALTRCNLGMLAYHEGDLARATVLLAEAVTFYRQAGDEYAYGAAVALSNLGFVTGETGDRGRAAALFRESLARWHAVRTREVLVDWLARVATVAAASGALAPAARLYGAAEAMRTAIDYTLEPPEQERHERAMAMVRAGLGEAAAATALAVGRTLSIDQATGEATTVINRWQAATGPRNAAGPWSLTNREREVLRLLVLGESDKAIATTLFITRRTASKHVSAILDKLGTSSRGAAAAIAVREGLV